ncbi:MAG TPA: hypothetical protein VEC36_12685, partial [Patescibacteria group bacterium]|nr:hypothetical protein [Patescibacteria group bacterium]
MVEIYLLCLVVGSVLIGLTLFGGHHDTGGDTTIHFPAHDNVEFHGHDHSHPFLSDVAQWLSIRNIIFFAAFFGLTGATLT